VVLTHVQPAVVDEEVPQQLLQHLLRRQRQLTQHSRAHSLLLLLLLRRCQLLLV
jgi:hypothetical protein